MVPEMAYARLRIPLNPLRNLVSRYMPLSPRSVNLVVTNKCNSRCKFCNIWNMYKTNPEIQRNEMTTEEIIGLFSDPLLRDVFVSITGGEPFLRNDIFYLIEWLVSKGYNVSINTNGFLPDLVSKLEIISNTKSLHVGISIDGPQKIHDELRGTRGAYLNAIKSLSILQKLGINKTISFTLCPYNVDYILDIYNLSKDYNASFAIRPAHIGIYYNNLEDYSINRDYTTEQIKSIERQIEYLISSGDYGSTMQIFLFGIVNYIKHKPFRLSCFAMQNFFFISPYGDISACPSLPYFNNIRRKLISGIWYSSEMNDLRRKIRGLNCPYCWNDCAMPTNIDMNIAFKITYNRLLRNYKASGDLDEDNPRRS